MTSFLPPTRLLIFDIDGLRQDVFLSCLKNGSIPNLAKLAGGLSAENGVHIKAVSTAPSITFCAQTTIFSGLQPNEHGISGNEFFDRLGDTNHGNPRFYAFDVGDALAVSDAVGVFSGEGLLNSVLSPNSKTLYELAGQNGMASLVAHHMLSRGAKTWARPSLVDIARFTKGGGLIGMSAEVYDNSMVDKLLNALQKEGPFQIITAYFMGLDHQSHQNGPQIQAEYLERVVDAQVGRIIQTLATRNELDDTLAVVVSDHGQVRVVADDRHSLRLSFPFDLEMGSLFNALGMDVNDKPGEGADSDAVVACNGGLAHVYLRRKKEGWEQPPLFDRDVLAIAKAFWEANQTGQYSADIQDALAAILIRNVERDGWEAVFEVFTPAGLISLDAFFPKGMKNETIEAISRLKHLRGAHVGDLLLIANDAAGFYFGAPIPGMHGGLHPGESLATFSMGWLGASPAQVTHLREIVNETIKEGSQAEKRMASLADLVPIIRNLWGWK